MTGSQYDVQLELFAHKEKLLKEQVVLQSMCSPTQSVTLIISARVLGRGKGTPLLKNGVRCVGVQMEDDSEASDWQDF
jgi:hypothetical protein